MNDAERAGRPAIAILGGGNLGRALAMGWTETGYCSPDRIRITRRHAEKLTYFAEVGFRVGSDNREAVAASDIIVLAVQPQQIASLLEEIRPAIDPARHRIISVVSGVTIRQLREPLGTTASIIRAMPNLPSRIGKGVVGLFSDSGDNVAKAEISGLMAALGHAEWFPDRRPGAPTRRACPGSGGR